MGMTTKLINSKLSVTRHKFKTRKWNKYNTPVPFTSQPTLSFRPTAQRALARHIITDMWARCEKTDDAPNWQTPRLIA